MSKYRNSLKAKCPFYCGESPGTVRCEGAYKNSYISVSFSKSEEIKKHKKEYCYSIEECELCEYYNIYREKR